MRRAGLATRPSYTRYELLSRRAITGHAAVTLVARAIAPIVVVVAAVIRRTHIIGVWFRIPVARIAVVVAIRPRRDRGANQCTRRYASGDARTPTPAAMPAPLRRSARDAARRDRQNAREGHGSGSKFCHVVLHGVAAT